MSLKDYSFAIMVFVISYIYAENIQNLSIERGSFFCLHVIPSIIFISYSLFLDITNYMYLSNYKLQPNKFVTLKQIPRIFFFVVINIVIVNTVLFLLFTTSREFLINNSQLNNTQNMLLIPDLTIWLRDIVVFALISECGFYYLHRLCHINKYLFRKVHYLHHELDAPIAFGAIYCHPLEQIFVNVLPLLIGPILLRSPDVIVFTWFVIAYCNTANAHCGYDVPALPSPTQHDWHHKIYMENFGFLGILDTLHKTNSKFKKQTIKDN